jgi:hypothetical protein
MTTSTIAKKSDTRAWRTRDAVGWLGLAASLMSLFHVSPWLKLASARPRQLTRPTTRAEGD